MGNGTSGFGRAFREDVQLETPLYVDPTCASYRALSMKRGIARTLGSWRTWVSLGRALRTGIRERRAGVIVRWWRLSVPVLIPGTQGNAWQLGGVLVVLPDGRIAYRRESTIAGDHPRTDEIIAALEASAR
jgi:AhpC/TSA antioxidant enzyme